MAKKHPFIMIKIGHFFISEKFGSAHWEQSQIRLIDAKRLQYKLGDISEEDFLEVKKRLQAFLK